MGIRHSIQIFVLSRLSETPIICRSLFGRPLSYLIYVPYSPANMCIATRNWDDFENDGCIGPCLNARQNIYTRHG